MARGYTRLSECASRVIVEKLLERLATSDETTIVVERQPDGKIRVTSNSWGDEAKVFMRDQVLELRGLLPKRRLHVARKTKHEATITAIGRSSAPKLLRRHDLSP